MATQFTLNDFKQNPDGSFSKIKTVNQPRENKTPTITKPVQNLTIKENKSKLPKQTYWKGKNIQDAFKEASDNNFIFIPNNVPSSKNSKRAFKGIVLESILCVEYRKKTDTHWQIFKPRFLKMIEGKEKPYRIEMFFIRKGQHRADFHNLVQLPMDLMVKFGWIDDDNMSECVPVPALKPFALDKHLPGIIIRVL